MQADFLAILSYEHLDNGMFLTSFARSLAKKKKRGIILHGDSEYTERIIQTGVMREDAVLRAIKDLNRRLVALLADQGVPAVSLIGYQKSLVSYDNHEVKIDIDQIMKLPGETMILLSGLAETADQRKPLPVPLNLLSQSIHDTLGCPITLFSIKEDADIIVQDLPLRFIPAKEKAISELHVPKDFRNFDKEVTVTAPSLF